MIIRDGYSQEAVEALAKYAGVPAFNGLTDEYHPTQMVADVMTMREFSDRPIHDDSADDCDEHAVKIEKGHAGMASKLKQPTANKRTNHPEDNVEEATCARAISTLLAIKPAISPRTIQPRTDISAPSIVVSTVH